MSTSNITSILLSLGILLICAQLLGELARRLGQPAILGELLVGIFLGPTIFGRVSPDIQQFIFPREGNVPIFFAGFNTFSISLFLLVAGMEINLSSVIKQGKIALGVSAGGVVIPFVVGSALAFLFSDLFGYEAGVVTPLLFALFIGTALSISALPVIAKTLMDLGIYKTPVGTVTMAAAIVDDLLGWIIFAMILSAANQSTEQLAIEARLGLTLLFTVLMLTIGRKIVDYGLRFFAQHFKWPGGVITFILSVALLCSAFTEWIGIHSLFGAFIAGVVIGDSNLMNDQAMQQDVRNTIDKFITSILATIVFATIGLKVDFWSNFNLQLTLIILVTACIGKIAGCTYAARLAGMPKNESFAVGFAMNSRGAMGLILAFIALESKIINEAVFVALATMAIVTSAASGPIIKKALKLR